MKIDGKMRNLQKRKFCIECSPFGSRNTRASLQTTLQEEKLCLRCNEVKTKEEFYRRRKGTDLSPYCKPCTVQQTIERQRKFKQNCIEYKGGQCEFCGYNRCDGALEFHHKDPNEKDFTIAHARLTSFNDIVKKELDKCMLVCANCHREEHAKHAGVYPQSSKLEKG